MEDKIITFESYHDPMLAHIIRSKFEAHGISCFIEGGSMTGLNPVYNPTVSGLKLKIFERDLEKCKDLVAEDESLELEEQVEMDPETYDTVVCPYCASTNVTHVSEDNTRPGWLNTFYSFLPFYSPKLWHCLNCKQDFE